jgi:membrane protein DedA with SNARE-associated domain
LDDVAVHRAARQFERWGGWGVFVTRFLLTPISLPINLLAGSTHFPWQRFMSAVIVGELLCVALFGGAGYVFADRWEDLSSIAGDSAAITLGLVLVTWGLIHLRRVRVGLT